MIFVKRYLIPPLFAIFLYTVTYFLTGGGDYLTLGLVFAILFALLVRLCDDTLDYEKDLAKGRATLIMPILISACLSVSVMYLALMIIFAKPFMSVAPVVVFSQFLLSEKQRDVIKPLFMPAAVMGIATSFFTLCPAIWIFSAILFILDIAIIIYKRSKAKGTNK